MFRIELLAPAEWKRFRAIRLRSLRESPEAFASSFANTAARPDDQWIAQLETMPTFVAVKDGQDLGVARGAKDDSRPETAWLLSMWVDPKARGLGLGEALIDAVVNWACKSGFSRLELDVADHNQHAIALYQRKGFSVTGESDTLPPPRDHVREHRRVLVLT